MSVGRGCALAHRKQDGASFQDVEAIFVNCGTEIETIHPSNNLIQSPSDTHLLDRSPRVGQERLSLLVGTPGINNSAVAAAMVGYGSGQTTQDIR